MPYTPPDSKLIAFSFTGAYTPPDSRMIGIDLIPPPVGSTQTLYPEGFNAAAFGSGGVSQPPAITPTGFSALAFGMATVANLSQGVTLAGLDSAEVGLPEKIWNYHSFFRVPRTDEATLWGAVWVANYKQYCYPGGNATEKWGTLELSKEDRGVHALKPVRLYDSDIAADQYSRPLVMGGYIYFSAHTQIADDSRGLVSNIDNFWVRAEYPSLNNPMRINEFDIGTAISPRPVTSHEIPSFATDGTNIFMIAVQHAAETHDYYDTAFSLYKMDAGFNYITSTLYVMQAKPEALVAAAGKLFALYPQGALGCKVYRIDKNSLAGVQVASTSMVGGINSGVVNSAFLLGAYIYFPTGEGVIKFDPVSETIVGTLLLPDEAFIVGSTAAQGYLWLSVGWERSADHTYYRVDPATFTYAVIGHSTNTSYQSRIGGWIYSSDDYVIAGPHGAFSLGANAANGGTQYYVFDASTGVAVGGFPGYNGISGVPATKAVPVLTREGRRVLEHGWPLYDGHPPPNPVQWLFTSLMMAPNGKTLLSVCSADTMLFGGETLDYLRTISATACFEMRIAVDTPILEILTIPSIAAPGVGTPSVKPQWQLVYPQGTKYGYVSEVALQLKTRYLLPPGINELDFGTPHTRYLTTVVAPDGFDSLDVPLVFVTDLSQTVYPATVLETAMFGDPPRVWNYNQIVAPPGVDQSYFPNFNPVVENYWRDAKPLGADFARVGSIYVRNGAQVFAATGFGGAVFGTVDIVHRDQQRAVDGFDAALYGEPYVVLGHIVAHPVGLAAPALGEPEVGMRYRTLWPEGIEQPSSDTEPWVSYRVRELKVGTNYSTLFGTAVLTHDVQYLPVSGAHMAVFGYPVVALSVRTVEPETIFFPTPAAAFGLPRLSPREQPVLVQPFGGEQFGTTQVARNELVIGEIGAGRQDSFGEPWTSLYRRYVEPRSGSAMDITGTDHLVWNWVQYVETFDYVLQHEVFGTPWLALRNKTLYPAGADTSKVSAYALIENKARLIAPPGTDTATFGEALVAASVRTLAPEGIYQTPNFGPWITVWNRAQVLLPEGIRRPWVGVPRVWRNEALVGELPGIPAPAMTSRPMVDFAIRTITQYRAPDPVMGFPSVGLYTQYVTPASIDQSVISVRVYVYEFFNRATIFGRDYLRMGAPEVRNNTPEIHAASIAYVPMGETWVSFRVRTVEQSGDSPLIYEPGRIDIALLNRKIYPGGADTAFIPITHRVDWDIPQVAPQHVAFPEGIAQPAFPQPSLRGQVLAPEGWDSAKVSGVVAEGMSVLVDSSHGDYVNYGYPTVTRRNRTIVIGAFPTTQIWEPSRVRIYPHIVDLFWGQSPCPAIDAWMADDEDPLARPFWGIVTVSNQHREINMRGSYFGGMGIPDVHDNQLKMEGWDSSEGKWGLPDFTGPLYVNPYWGRSTEDYIPEVPAFNFDTAKYGAPEVAFPEVPPVWSPYITPNGTYHTKFGQALIEHRDRRIFPGGFEFFPGGEQVPWVWAHPPFRLLPEGIDSAILPEPMVAYRIREIITAGEDSASVCLEESETISLRFRVVHGRHACAVDGWDSGAPGIPMIADRIRTLHPEGFDRSRVRVAHVDGVNITQQTGWDSLAFGDVRRVNEGEIITGWFDSLATGYVRLSRTAPVSGIAAPNMADPRIARQFNPAGFDQLEPGRVAVTNPYGCRDRVIIVGAGSDFSTFGVNHVTQ